MLRVLDECDHVATDFSADPVHDLRVALRRCRSLADGMMAMDPDPDWKAMKKAGKQLFQSLGALRDVQIMMEWIDHLHPEKAGEALPQSSADGPEQGSVTSIELESQKEVSGKEANSSRDPAAHALLVIL